MQEYLHDTVHCCGYEWRASLISSQAPEPLSIMTIFTYTQAHVHKQTWGILLRRGRMWVCMCNIFMNICHETLILCAKCHIITVSSPIPITADVSKSRVYLGKERTTNGHAAIFLKSVILVCYCHNLMSWFITWRPRTVCFLFTFGLQCWKFTRCSFKCSRQSHYENIHSVRLFTVSALRCMNGASQPAGTDCTLCQRQVCFQSAEVTAREREREREERVERGERGQEWSGEEESRGGDKEV